ncbi:6-bladed beta-propeller [Aliifodinibius salicampi]|uniref:6-bladed beta-propeller n=1 Tax=Fodinibius salicampi TaxID=1920655 RepID=A0ABT3PWM2_9BACT|nr:6-bladed beta-propeller [Fodinibius salicampi]MCW9712259.1 6-bladed beta-propeller [Fodinibius salicampi]
MKILKIIAYVSVYGCLLVIIGCSTHQKDRQKQTHKADRLDIPQHIQALDSLTVYSLDKELTDTIRFEKEAMFTDSVGIGSMGTVAVDEQGRVYIAEGGIKSNRQTIHVFEPDGSHISTMGRAGAGPGEFQILSDIQIQSNHLYAYDYKLQRINVFSLRSLSSTGTVKLNPQSWDNIEELSGYNPDQGHYFVRNDSTFLFGFAEPLRPDNPNNRYRRYYLLDWEGNIISDQIFKEKDVNLHQGTGMPGPQLAKSPTLPFHRNALMVSSTDGHIFSAWTEEFLIKKYDPAGKYLEAFYYPYTRSALREEDILARYKNYSRRMKQAVHNTEFPKTWPALHYMLLDDENRLWVCTISDDSDYYRWWVMDENGKPMGIFKWPGRRLFRNTEERRIKVIKDGYLYAVKTNEETGVQQLIKYRIQM